VSTYGSREIFGGRLIRIQIHLTKRWGQTFSH
jgi:hypothetical protein